VSPFHVALTADFFDAAGAPKFADMGLSVFESRPQIQSRPFAEHRPVIGSDQLTGANGVIVLTPAVTRDTVSAAENLLAVGRFGVGYDNVDVAACTEADVLVFITAGAVDRSVAEAVVAWMLALTHHVGAKDRLVRNARWDDRSKFMGCEIRDRTLGVVGMGGIARKTIQLVSGFGMNPPLAFDPYVDPATATVLGVRLVDLDELMRSSDFVSIHCPLTPQTRGLIGKREIALMRPNAYLINTARGNIVDEDALYDALQGRRISGAAIDCFATEPLTSPPRLAELENVLLAPHSIAWTNELFRDIGRAACQGMVDLSLKQRPRSIINPEVLDRRGFQDKWNRLVSAANS
jgi:phosphoglycerate dehydrogenase-like enzyme